MAMAMAKLEALLKSQANPNNDKPCPNLTTNIHILSGYAGGAAQISQANQNNDKGLSLFNYKHPQFNWLRWRCSPNFTSKCNQ
jgi:hypothetical protein